MEYRALGRTGLEVAPLAFGGNVFGWTLDEAASFRMLDMLAEKGLNFIDTADVYSRWVPGNRGGESETIIGRWFKQSGKRDQVVLATKVGFELGVDQKGLSRGYIRAAVDASLARLQTDYIDLYQAHIDDPHTPLEETLATFDELVREGKVRAIGASNHTGPRLAKALAISAAEGLASYTTLQPLYNLYDRSEFEQHLLPLCRQHDIAVITYFSLASGFLTGKYRRQEDLAGHARGGTVGKYLTERGLRILDALDAVALAHRSMPASVALAWLMARPTVAAPIVSATSASQLQALLAAIDLRLTAADHAALDDASA